MNRQRSILHLNVADFAVAVERVADRSLCQKPIIVAPLQAARAAVYDMSDEAYNDGVRKGMLLNRASRICRSARILAPNFALYRRAMEAFVNEARSYSPIIEYGAEDGHLYLDITGTHRLFGAAPDVGWRLHRQIRNKLEIDPIWSLAANKLVSKVGSRLVKPVGEYIVADGEEQGFLAPLALQLLPGLRAAEMQRLEEFNIVKIGQLALLTRVQLYGAFGKRGETLFEISHGIDRDIVRPETAQLPTIKRGHVFNDDTAERRSLEGVANSLAAHIGMELRETRMVARRVAVALDFSDGSQVIRQATVRRGVSDDESLQNMALLALKRAVNRRTRVRSCLLTCDRLHRRSPQLPLFAEPGRGEQRREKLLAAMDTVRRRFGSEAIRVGKQAILH